MQPSEHGFVEHGLTIIEYSDDLADTFYTINAQWIETMFVLEAHDIEVLKNPGKYIIDPGGVILFVKSPVHGIVGACALMKTGEGAFELTKMGVTEAVRGQKAGEFLLEAILERAREMDVRKLYLLTNHICEAAIHLYEKLGFQHDVGIMAEYGATYDRCDVAMIYPHLT
jgi:ribosomal protein S18 acetylase RimI-like enzyme